jgi:hypothetical protein
MVLGGLGAFVVFASQALRAHTRRDLTTNYAGTWAAAFCSASRS